MENVKGKRHKLDVLDPINDKLRASRETLMISRMHNNIDENIPSPDKVRL